MCTAGLIATFDSLNETAMTRNTRDDVRVAELQEKVRNHFGTSISELIFEFQEEDGVVRLNLVTVNPRHRQSFLFHTTTGTDRSDAMDKMWDYVKHYRDREQSYTIQWKIRGDTELHTSYFHAKNTYEALDKLYYDRDMNAITVFSVVLNPMS